MTEATEPGAPTLAELVRASRLPEPAERKRIREAAGLSLQRMADALGVTASAVSYWENGVDGQGPSLENAVKYRALLDELTKAVA